MPRRERQPPARDASPVSKPELRAHHERALWEGVEEEVLAIEQIVDAGRHRPACIHAIVCTRVHYEPFTEPLIRFRIPLGLIERRLELAAVPPGERERERC